MNDIVQEIILRNFKMSSTSLETIMGIVEYIEYQKNDIFIVEGKRDSREYFVLEGVCRSFLLNPDGEEVTISFFSGKSIMKN